MSLTGLMQATPLSIPHIFHRAEQQFGEKQIISVEAGRVRRTSVAEWAERVRALATALDVLGISPGATVATFAGNTQAHLELYYAVPCTGRVLHPLNIRLSIEQLCFIIETARDEVIFIDRGLLAQLWPVANSLEGVRHWVVMDDGSNAPIAQDTRILDYDDVIARADAFEGTFEIADENQAAGLCFTSGTTGPPKGVVYSHRSTVLHALVSLAAGLVGITERDRVLPIVPMFHADAWGLPYSALFAGAELVLPGSDLTPAALLKLIDEQRVTVATGVPAIWAGMLPLLDTADVSSLRAVFGGGSATPPPLASAWEARVGIPITHTWGMTELSPTGAIGGLRSLHDRESDDARTAAILAQGTAVPLVELRIADLDDGRPLPRDGVAVGELQARGPTVASAYLGHEPGDALTEDGWLRTGDLASIDRRGYVVIRDRLKDLIKSGGEWIPSLALEHALAEHPGVSDVAIVARAHDHWGERPVAFVVLREGAAVESAELLQHLRSRVVKWWLPDEIVFLDAMPRTGTGKIAKPELRSALAS